MRCRSTGRANRGAARPSELPHSARQARGENPETASARTRSLAWGGIEFELC